MRLKKYQIVRHHDKNKRLLISQKAYVFLLLLHSAMFAQKDLHQNEIIEALLTFLKGKTFLK